MQKCSDMTATLLNIKFVYKCKKKNSKSTLRKTKQKGKVINTAHADAKVSANKTSAGNN